MSKIPSNLPNPGASSPQRESSSAVKKLATRVKTIARPAAPSKSATAKQKHSYSKEPANMLPKKVLLATLAKIKAVKTKA